MLKYFAFWGIIFLLILVFGFGVSIQDIYGLAKSLEMYLAVYCIYLLVSIILYPILALFCIIRSSKLGFSFSETLAIHLQPTLWIPYKGLDIHELFKLKSLGLNSSGIWYEIRVHIIRLFETALWWFVVISGINTVRRQGNNAILHAIEQKTTRELLIIAGLSIAAYCVIKLLVWLIDTAVTKRWQRETRRSSYKLGTRGQRYYDRFPERMPAGCRACGGPYPECRSSCPLFDE